MDKYASNQQANPLMRRDFLRAASVLGLGTLAAGTLPGLGLFPNNWNMQKATIKRVPELFSKKREHWALKKIR